jgi:hypothetical protein
MVVQQGPAEVVPLLTVATATPPTVRARADRRAATRRVLGRDMGFSSVIDGVDWLSDRS